MSLYINISFINVDISKQLQTGITQQIKKMEIDGLHASDNK